MSRVIPEYRLDFSPNEENCMTELPDIFIGKNRFSLPEMMPVHQYGACIAMVITLWLSIS
jgi:hypothetical protein